MGIYVKVKNINGIINVRKNDFNQFNPLLLYNELNSMDIISTIFL